MMRRATRRLETKLRKPAEHPARCRADSYWNQPSTSTIASILPKPLKRLKSPGEPPPDRVIAVRFGSTCPAATLTPDTVGRLGASDGYALRKVTHVPSTAVRLAIPALALLEIPC